MYEIFKQKNEKRKKREREKRKEKIIGDAVNSLLAQYIFMYVKKYVKTSQK